MEVDHINGVSLTLEHGMEFDVFDTLPVREAGQWYQSDQGRLLLQTMI